MRIFGLRKTIDVINIYAPTHTPITQNELQKNNGKFKRKQLYWEILTHITDYGNSIVIGTMTTHKKSLIF